MSSEITLTISVLAVVALIVFTIAKTAVVVSQQQAAVVERLLVDTSAHSVLTLNSWF